MIEVALPDGWNRRRLRFDARFNPVKSGLSLPDETQVSFVPMEAVGEYGGLQLDQTRSLGDIYTGYTYFADGDLCIAKITPCFENGKGALAAGLTNGIGFGTTELHVVRPTETLDARYLFYVSIASDFRGFGASEMLGAGGQKRVPEAFLKDWRAPLPPLETQERIAAFLDKKTAQIDALITRKRALLARLAEKRQATITQAVTKGLNPAAPLKESGIDWLGQIPAHWEVKRLRRISPKQSVGVVVNPSNYIDETGFRSFIYGANISEFAIDWDGARRLTDHPHRELEKSELHEGDLVTVRVGEPGVTAVVDARGDGSNCASVMFIRRGNFCSRWLAYVMNSRAGRSEVERVAYGAAQKQFNIEHALYFRYATPPLQEQEQIADYLDIERRKLDQVATVIRGSMQRLKEYRSALITSAVTGQIEGLR